MDKQTLRRKISQLRDQLSERKRELYSKKIRQRLEGLLSYKKAHTILYFVSFRSEVNTIPLIKKGLAIGKRVILPITNLSTGRLTFSELKDFDKELVVGTYGILEPKKEFIRPVQPEEIDFVLMPGLVFDHNGYRIGYGGGFYDRFLGELTRRPKLVAVAYELQVMDKPLPHEDHDIPVDMIVTEKRLIYCVKNRKEEVG
ncbi:5-formyltetrahydrofolate cyclo-ligase [Anoxybacter fermentans]|uniref:5-formyltetrahydrofolate cyclo-ligase n=1 Tax=Anoxybacter fermentans TaxID=1323375 RepID=A0A3S9SXS3_9FIRM|nr:5-formyltetrahydrofolate cyclo-ligase [Anoxybacter fermentans]AZR73085.1 5-formyltetrahydrofolate cyclo-ligase [Anoxybacter fermentans]